MGYFADFVISTIDHFEIDEKSPTKKMGHFEIDLIENLQKNMKFN